MKQRKLKLSKETLRNISDGELSRHGAKGGDDSVSGCHSACGSYNPNACSLDCQLCG